MKSFWLKSKVLLLVLCLLPTFSYAYGESEQSNDKEEKEAQIPGDIYGQIKVIGDVDGDGMRDLVFGATDGKIHIYSAEKNQEIIRPPVWPMQTGGPIITSVEVASTDEGTLIAAASMDGNVYCVKADGTPKWSVKTHGIITSPNIEIADVDNDHHYEFLAGSGSGSMFCIEQGGQIKWEHKSARGISSTVTAQDLDGDGKKEIIFKDKGINAKVLDHKGMDKEGWPVRTAENGEWSFDLDAGDINGDGIKEVFGTDKNGKMTIWDNHGKVLKKLVLPGGSHSAPVLADLDGDGKNEFIICHYKSYVSVIDSDGKMRKGWPYSLGDQSVYSRPTIIDIDGDGKLDIVYTALREGAEKEASGFVMALDYNGKPIEGFPKNVGRVMAPPTFADLDNDGKLEMIIAGGVGYTGKQVRIFKTKASVRIRMVVIDQEIKFK